MFLIISDELGCFMGNLFIDVVDEGVHDRHGSLGDTSVWVNLLEDSVDIDGEGLGSLGLSLWGNGFLDVFGGGVSSGFTWHFNFNYLNFVMTLARLNIRILYLRKKSNL